MLQRTALDTGEYGRIEDLRHHLHRAFGRGKPPRVFEIPAHEDNAAARSAQGLVGRRSDDMRVFHGVVQQSCSDQAGRVGHVHEQQRADFVRDFAHAFVVPFARIGRSAADDQFRLAFQRLAFHGVVVDHARRLVELVAHGVEVFARHVDRRTVRQMTAVRQIEPHKSIARLEHRQENGHVRLRSRVRLHVSVFGAVQLAQTVDGQLLHLIHHFATAVITRPRIPFGIFVSQHGTHRLHNLLAYKVLGSDQLDTVQLPLLFALDQSE